MEFEHTFLCEIITYCNVVFGNYKICLELGGPSALGGPEFQTYFIVTVNDITVCDNFTQKCVFTLQWAKFTHNRNNYLFSKLFQG